MLRTRSLGLILFSISITYLCLSSSPLITINNSYDPNIYFNIGKSWFQGILPYKDLFDQKGPLLFLIYGIGSLISTKSFFGVYIIQTILFYTNSIFTYKIARLYLSGKFSLLIAITFPLFLSYFGIGGGSAEEFITPLQTISIYIFLRYISFPTKKINYPIFALGLLAGGTFLIKFNVIIFWIPIIFVILINNFYFLREKIYKSIFVAIIGFIIPILPFVVYFSLNNALYSFLECYILFNLKYASGATVPTSFLHEHFLNFIKYHWFYFIFMIVGVIMFTFSTKINATKNCRYAILLSFILMYAMIFPTVHGYYYVSLNIFLIFGLLYIGILVQNAKKRFIYLYIAGSLILLSFFYILSFSIKRNLERTTEEYNTAFKNILRHIDNDKSATMMSTSLWTVPFTYSGIYPSNYFFFYPNISKENYPDINKSQTSIIEKKKVMYIIFNKGNIALDMNILLENYTLIEESHDPSTKDTYYLYKKREKSK